jgi:hypothetical protein
MNMSILKMVVMIIGMTILASIFGMIYLIVNDKAIPGTLETITALCVGGLLGLLAPSKEVTGPTP